MRKSQCQMKKNSYLPTALFASRYYAPLLFVVNNTREAVIARDEVPWQSHTIGNIPFNYVVIPA